MKSWPKSLPAGETELAKLLGCSAMVDFENLDTPMRLEDTIRLLNPGTRTSVVARIEFFKQGEHWCRSLIHRQPFVLRSQVPEGTQLLSVLGGVVTRSHLGSVITADKEQILALQAPDERAPFRVIEACTGLGGITKGAEAAGFTTISANELRPKFVEVLKATSDFPVVQGNLGKLKTIRDLWVAAKQCGLFAMGFNCQPFSAGGDQKAEHDQRSLTLPHGLFAAWVFQSPIVLLECVTEAISNGWVRSTLAEFLNLTKFEYSEVCLDLGDFWPSSRRRWWAILSHGSLGKIPLCALPKLPFEPCVADLLPRFLPLPLPELASLTLSKQELAQFAQYSKSLEQHVVNPNKMLPTALHSWGNQTRGCACECRSLGFSHFRLQKRGLYSALVVNDDQTHLETGFRHLSAQETALLCGWPRQKGWNFNPRLLLAGIGQLASPIQATWILAHLRQHLFQIGFRGLDFASPKELLAKLCFEIFELRDEWFPGEGNLAMQVFEEQITSLLQVSPRRPIVSRPARPAETATTWQCRDPECPLEQFLREAEQSPQETADDHAKQQLIEIEPTLPFDFVEPDVMPAAPPAEECSVVSSPVLPSVGSSRAKDESLSGWNFQQTGGVPGFATGQKRSHEESLKGDDFRADVSLVSGVPKECDVGGSSSKAHVESDQVEMQMISLNFSLPSVAIRPNQIFVDRMLLIHAEVGTAQFIQVKDGSTVRDLIAAEANLSGHSLFPYDALGFRLDPDHQLAAKQIVILSPCEMNLPDFQSIQAVEQAMVSTSRLLGLTLQGAFVACDEIMFYMLSVAKVIGASCVSPLILHSLEALSLQAEEWMLAVCHHLASHQQVISLILVDGHWHPVHIQWHPSPNQASKLSVTVTPS